MGVGTWVEDRVYGNQSALESVERPFYELRAEDLAGRAHVVRLEAIEEKRGQVFAVVEFRYATRKLLLDVINNAELDRLFPPDYEACIGKYVVLYPDQGVIRIRAPADLEIRSWRRIPSGIR